MGGIIGKKFKCPEFEIPQTVTEQVRFERIQTNATAPLTTSERKNIRQFTADAVGIFNRLTGKALDH